MYKRFMHTKEEDLVDKAKVGDNEAMNELLSRYYSQIHSMAGKFLHQYRQVTYAAFEDLISIAQNSLFLAIQNYDKELGTFNAYWRKVAMHNVIDYIQECKLETYERISSGNEDKYIISHENLASFYALEDDVNQIINDPKNDINELEAELFFAFISGDKLSELAEEYHMPYSTIQRKVDKVRNKIRDILFHS